MSLLVDLNPPDKDENPAFAELSTVNWIFAIYSEIVNEYGENADVWKTKLSQEFSSVSYKKATLSERRIFQKLFHSVCLSLSIENKYKSANLLHSDIVGTISDFYYSLYNIFISYSMMDGTQEAEKHSKNIGIFSTTRKNVPYPFNIFSQFDSSSWNGKKLISPDNFLHNLPNRLSTTDVSNSEINRKQFSSVLRANISQDILLGYLRGTCGFEIEKTTRLYKRKNKIERLDRQDDKDFLNKIMKREFNFMHCLFRYRTKAHYRDFTYLCYNYTDPSGFTNDYLTKKYYLWLHTILEFAICSHIAYAQKRIGASTVNRYLDDIRKNMKDKSSIKNTYWGKVF
jgi:hypothetical protein